MELDQGQVSTPSLSELERACASARRHGYDCTIFRFGTYQPRKGCNTGHAEMPDELIIVSVIWPGVRPSMYRAASGAWLSEFEHDLANLRFDRRAARRAA